MVFLLQAAAQVHEAGGTGKKEKHRPADCRAVGVECLLPMQAQHAGEAENK
jgi:hypothetical protein